MPKSVNISIIYYELRPFPRRILKKEGATGPGKECAAMDEQSAWASFVKTGRVEDYLRYVQCRSGKEENQTDADAGHCTAGFPRGGE